MTHDQTVNLLRPLFDGDWYSAIHPDVAAAGQDPLAHYISHGAEEGRDPNPFFDGAWYVKQHGDVDAAKMNPLLHYLLHGAAELRNPHPRFDAAFYAEAHPDASSNVLLFHMIIGRSRGFATEPVVDIDDYLPSTRQPAAAPAGVSVDVVIPVYRGLEQTRACLESVLADRDRMPGLVIVVDDRSPEPALSAYLDRLNDDGAIRLIRNSRNIGFVASVNRGMEAAGRHDIALLNSDTVVPPGWTRRLAAHAYATNRTGTVSPLSNNATICSYPTVQGGPLRDGLTVESMDAAARAGNAGRAITVPTTVGFCMYIRRACLDDIDPFDTETFGRGYGEEVDFCLRANARGWRHLLACDTYVYHEGGVSFGAQAREAAEGFARLVERYPEYPRLIDRHVRRDPAGPARLALTLTLWRATPLPVILMMTHGLGGGVRHHIDRLVGRLGTRAHVLLLEATAGGVALSVPAFGERPRLELPNERAPDLLRFLREARVSRVHVHHTLGVGPHPRALIAALGVPFDFTAHDYFSICPQVNLLPRPDLHYCGEPPPAGCNACIAQRPSHGARDILSWRADQSWLLRDAARVLCPTQGVRDRLRRYRPNGRYVVAAHEPALPGPWRVDRPTLGGGARLRVALLGVLADHKGAATVATVIEMADPERFEFVLIGPLEKPLPTASAGRLKVGGPYKDADLATLIERSAPHVAWFPAHWPETYSYTLSSALGARLPVVAADIGAFPERLAGRPETWLVSADAPAATWLEALERVRDDLSGDGPLERGADRAASADYYPDSYLRPPATPATARSRKTIIVVPERLDSGILSPCAYIRLLLPLDHSALAFDYDVVVASPEDALHRAADVIVTQRHAFADAALAERLVSHCQRTGTRLIYDLDDDLIGIPRDHPEAARLRPLARVVESLARAADALWVSTPALRDRLAPIRAARVIENGLDERLWSAWGRQATPRTGALRVLMMGTATHARDLAVIRPALRRLRDELGGRLSIDVVGMVDGDALPSWLNRLHTTPVASASYPGFVDWLVHQPAWDLGIAPLADTPFNGAKSAIKTMDYAALGLAVLASDVPAYRGSLADDAHPHAGGLLVANTTTAWVEAVGRMVRNPRLREELAANARAAFADRHTLLSQAPARRAALDEAMSANGALPRPR